ncbi:hypothetical protein [Rhodopila globiformis]|uniref:Uncharacterized protein n=1 Tax=Rhodopila globiformis TaxID=1071 RepID=A0A2S6NLB0_RHOGL|nr:hypothetical protein [Rhodopila globiformis]PPQ36096.1 hypothetical protein CCS01_05720 [Rhodopila globiformis]
MRAIIEDTWFPAGTRIRIGQGSDELLFIRCSFEGGEIVFEREVDRTIFSQCIFRGTRFIGQTLCDRIASACSAVAGETEDTAAQTASRHGRFRR